MARTHEDNILRNSVFLLIHNVEDVYVEFINFHFLILYFSKPFIVFYFQDFIYFVTNDLSIGKVKQKLKKNNMGSPEMTSKCITHFLIFVLNYLILIRIFQFRSIWWNKWTYSKWTWLKPRKSLR